MFFTYNFNKITNKNTKKTKPHIILIMSLVLTLKNLNIIILKIAIKNNSIIEKIVLKAEKDTGLGIVKNYGMYNDGGTAEYTYNNYNIIKCDKLSENGNIKDVYITRGDIKYTDIPREEITDRVVRAL